MPERDVRMQHSVIEQSISFSQMDSIDSEHVNTGPNAQNPETRFTENVWIYDSVPESI